MLRRLLQVIAAISLLLFLGSLLLWMTSYLHPAEWELPTRRGVTPLLPAGFAGSYGSWNTYRWIGTSRGRVQFLERTVEAQPQSGGTPRMRVGYWMLDTPGLGANGRRYVLADSGLLRSSVLHYSMPAQISDGYVPTTRMLPFARLVPGAPGARGSTAAVGIANRSASPGIASAVVVGPASTQPSPMVMISPPSRGSGAYTLNGAVQSMGPGMSYRSGTRTLIVAWWIPTLLFSILPAMALVISARRRRRLRHKGCSACDYNLTGNTSGICPECGTKLIPSRAVTS